VNKPKNIVLISPFFSPEPISTGKFNTDMVIKLQDEGHNVTVLCSHPIYPGWIPQESFENLKGVNIIRGGKRIKYSKNASIRRIILEIWYTLFIIKNINKYQKNSDTILPVFPPSLAFYCVSFFLKKDIKKIGIVHDLQIIYSSQKKGLLNSLLSNLIKSVEKRSFNKCDKLIFLSKEMQDTACYLYKIDKTKSVVQFPFTSIKGAEINNNLIDILPEKQHNIVYSGALGEKQNPEEVYQVFDFISKNLSNSCFYFFSQGAIFDSLKERNRNKKIQFYPLVNKNDIQELYTRSSVQIVPQLPNTSKGSLPSKLPNILASGTKVLVITDKNSELEKLFNENNLQKVITTWDKYIILSSIEKLLEEQIDINKQKEISQKLFNINNLIDKIVS
jgi:colanic acid biosynthesis glycosyl transferase WcaI